MIKQGNKLASVIYDIESDRLGTKQNSKKRAMEELALSLRWKLGRRQLHWVGAGL